MNSGILPLVLLGLALGLALTSVSVETAWKTSVSAAAAALVVCFVPIPPRLSVAVEVGLWITTVLTATTVFLPKSWTTRLIWPVAISAGVWLGAMASVGALRLPLLAALPLLLIFVPISMMGLQKSGIAMRVAASWMIAIGSLAVFVSMVPTPGYKQDHMQ